MAFLILVPSRTVANPYLVAEPQLETRMVWDVSPNGNILISYDLDGNGIADFFSLRIVIQAYFGEKDPLKIKGQWPGKFIFLIQHESTNFYYITGPHPHFYAIDINEDGHWDLIYKDVSEDSVNGNEVFYASPSGMFTKQIASIK